MNFMFDKANNILTSLSDVNNLHLLQNLIEQLNKDFIMSGLDDYFNPELNPKELLDQLQERIGELFLKEPKLFSNLMYRIDISEMHLLKQKDYDFHKTRDNITLAILEREWRKVWFRNRNSPLE